MSTERDKEQFTISRRALRALLFWAAIGVRKSRGGTYGDFIEELIAEKASQLNLRMPYHIPLSVFGEDRPKRRRKA